jgi:hypothetical protein
MFRPYDEYGQPIPRFVDIDLGINRTIVGYTDVFRLYRLGEVLPERGDRRAICHPTREDKARGMCEACYYAWRRWIHGIRKTLPAVLVELGMGQNGRDPDERLTIT